MPQPQLTNEGPTHDEIQLIGIELAAQDYSRREVELEMHGFKHTMPYRYGDSTRLRVTVHTSNGDVTVRFPLRPGNYETW